jgi:hypothetical protein
MSHETDLSSTEAKKALFARFWTSFLHMRPELPVSNVRKLSRSRMVDETG